MHPLCADDFLQDDNMIKNMVIQARDNQDILLAKILRNLSERTNKIQLNLLCQEKSTQGMGNYKMKEYWCNHIPLLFEMTITCENHDLLVELIGTLHNLTSNDLPDEKTWADIISQFTLGSFIAKLLMPGMAENDIILETIALSGHICVDNQSAWLLSNSKVVYALIGVWQERSIDPEISGCLLFVFYKFLHFPDIRDELLNSQGEFRL